MFTVQLNAQHYVGGRFSVNSSGGKYDDGSKKPSSLNLSINPEIGTFLSENLAAGITLQFGINKTNNMNEVETINTSTVIGVAPYIRKYAVLTGNLSLFGQAQAGIGMEKSKSKTGNNSFDGPTETTISLGIFPGLSYELNDKISLETTVNLFQFGVSSTIEKSGSDKETSTNIGFGAGLENLVNTSNISVGAIFKF